jgi:uncharacterized membrane protein YbaN (DUF454 family)
VYACKLVSPAKIGLALLVAALLVVGVAGLVLPIIPGLLFLALAAVIAAKHFPTVGARMRKHRALGKHWHIAERFDGLALNDKLRMAGWLGLKMIAETLALIERGISRPRR